MKQPNGHYFTASLLILALTAMLAGVAWWLWW
jgi:hypothetical protein